MRVQVKENPDKYFPERRSDNKIFLTAHRISLHVSYSDRVDFAYRKDVAAILRETSKLLPIYNKMPNRPVEEYMSSPFASGFIGRSLILGCCSFKGVELAKIRKWALKK